MSIEPAEQVHAAQNGMGRTARSAATLRLDHRWFHVEVIAGTLVYFALLYPLLKWNPVAGLMVVLLGAILGLMITMVAMAWAVVIAFAEDARAGVWFVVFPPFMVVFAVRHWAVMSQPSTLFLMGMLVAFGSAALGYVCTYSA